MAILFHRVLVHAAPPLSRPTLLALPGPQVGRIIGRVQQLFLDSRGHLGGLPEAGLAVAVLPAVVLEPIAS